MKATKGNREYIIEESQVKAYRDSGFDVKDDDGNVIAYGKGKTVPYEVYMAVVKEKERLQLQVEKLQNENEALQGMGETFQEKEDAPEVLKGRTVIPKPEGPGTVLKGKAAKKAGE